ncbi:MAG TPA: alcohol dehydrogenase catalytic domain-containing protein [Ktedonobacteraceae bacterium]|jgi:2-desacetyl-2-hydroxyethyl bacteriochlorophyllide A dehydrogenase
MWTSTLEISLKKVVPTRFLGLFWRGAYFSSLAPLQVRNVPRCPLTGESGDRVRVHNRLAGICGSDLHLVFLDADLRIAPAALPAQAYAYPGHEVTGEVIEIGDRVQNLHVGDRVVLQNGPNCLSAGVQPPCNACATAHYNLCENGNLPGPGQIGGGWSEEMLVREQQLFRIPPQMEDEQAVLLEPSAVALHAVLRRLPRAGEKVLIVGAGTIGLLTLQVVRALAPQTEVSVMARHGFQVEQATRLGAEHILYGRDSYESIEKVTAGKLYTGMLGNKMLLGGYDVIYDTVGTRQTIHDSLRWSRARGIVVLVGVSLHPMKVDLSPIWHQEVTLLGAVGHSTEQWPAGTDQTRPTFAIAADLISSGLLHPEKLITHRFALSSYREALQAAADKKSSRAIKVVFDAALLPASSVPNVHPAPAARLRLPLFKTEAQDPALESSGTDTATSSAAHAAPTSGPSHFTMAQSEDFTADFDNMQFVNPRVRRPPKALQFRHTSGDSSPGTASIRHSGVTNGVDQTLEHTEGVSDNSTQAPQHEV